MRAKKVDKSQAEIVKMLRGAYVPTTVMSAVGDDFPDLITDFEQWVLIEVKDDSLNEAKMSRGQMRFIAKSCGYVGVATDFDSAYNIATEPEKYALSEMAKTRIANWLAENPNQEQLRLKSFFKLIQALPG